MRREFQFASINDVQGTIHANDSKSSAALIVHGLLFAGVLSLTVSLDGAYDQATDTVRSLAWVFLGLALLLFMASVFCLLRAVSPYSPEKRGAIGEPTAPSIFYPTTDYLGKAERNDALARGWRARHFGPKPRGRRGLWLAYLNTEVGKLSAEGAREVLAFEMLKLMKVREHEARWAKRGFWFLAWEVVAVAAYLALPLSVAADLAGTRQVGVDEPPRLSFVVELDGGARLSGDGYGPVEVPPGERVAAVRVEAAGTRLSEVRLSRTVSVACRGAREPLEDRAVRIARSSGGENRLRAGFSFAPAYCGAGIRAVTYAVTAEAETLTGASARDGVVAVDRR